MSTETVSIEDFAKLEIKIGTILAAERVPDTDKLVRFEIDLGTERRQIVGGFAPSYPDPTVLIGKQVPVLTNLAPRTMRGLESQGMILAASGKQTTSAGKEILTDSTTGSGPVALHPDTNVEPGTIVR